MSKSVNTCIWMEAGVLEFQLCPLHYNCDQCEIHQRLIHGAAGDDEQTRRDLQAVRIPNDIKVHQPGIQCLPGYVWLQRTSRKTVKLGLNPFLWHLFPLVEKILLARESRDVEKNACLSWLHFHGGMICIRSPLSGTIIRRNTDIDGEINNPQSLRYNGGFSTWLVELETHPEELGKLTILSCESVETNYVRDLHLLEEWSRDPVHNRGLGSESEPRRLNNLLLPRNEFGDMLKKFTLQLAFVC